MNQSTAESHRLAKRIAAGAAVVIALLVGLGAWYVNDYYHADERALQVMADEDGAEDGVVVQERSDGFYALVPDDPVAGLIFYPGAKVQPEAYAPLMERCAENGLLCVVVCPPFNLAILDADAAKDVMSAFPEVDDWVLSGHSLGGVVAAGNVSDDESAFCALALLASYATDDLSSFEGGVLSIVGTNDQVLNRERYDEAWAKLPADAQELVLEGGNHAFFGDYGAQDGDGSATMAREDQQEQTAAAIVALAEQCAGV